MEANRIFQSKLWWFTMFNPFLLHVHNGNIRAHWHGYIFLWFSATEGKTRQIWYNEPTPFKENEWRCPWKILLCTFWYLRFYTWNLFCYCAPSRYHSFQHIPNLYTESVCKWIPLMDSVRTRVVWCLCNKLLQFWIFLCIY